MVLLLFTDQSVVEIDECENVIYEQGKFNCVDSGGRILGTFPERDIHGYTLDPYVIQGFKRPSRKGRASCR